MTDTTPPDNDDRVPVPSLEPPYDDTVPPMEATFDTFRDAVAWVYALVRHGKVWVGWSPDGRYAFGDHTSPPADNITVVDPNTEPFTAAALAGATAQNIVNQAIARQRAGRIVTPNRAARRAAGRNPGAPGGGLILPGMPPR